MAAMGRPNVIRLTFQLKACTPSLKMPVQVPNYNTVESMDTEKVNFHLKRYHFSAHTFI
jgi:hypothetical protein